MARLFGTDGVRGTANLELTAEIALELSVAAAHVLGEAGAFHHQRRPRALVGRDTRASGEFLEAAVVAGLASAGVDVVRLGVIPTPGVAHLVGQSDADLGVMLSASHNPMPDNGIKFFARGGVKLDDDIEDAIEARMEEVWLRPTGSEVGRVVDDRGAIESYIAHLVSSLGPDASLDGLKVVIDCANGAAHLTAPSAFEAQGATVVALHAAPDGLNINDRCGSTHLSSLQRAVVEHGADLGIALDGDADRCLAVDATGEVVDGDQILAILALAMREAQTLHSDTVVATVMSNLGFLNAMRAAGIQVDQTKVGDRYVLEAMNANGFTLGGEQSGHVIMSEFATTGDGVLTALHLAARMVRTGTALRELAAVVVRLPQVMINVPQVKKARAGIDPVVNAAVSAAARELGRGGRVLLRPSGTEPLVRVMVEAETIERATEVAERLAAVVRDRLSLEPATGR
ncbi:MAG: phosphoglucosamine mutase [Propionicimonas sp.]